MSKRGDPGLTSMTVLRELLKAGNNGLTLGVLQDRIKETLGSYLTDGRTRSVKHAIANLRKYGIISEKMSIHGEPVYIVLPQNGHHFIAPAHILLAMDDLARTFEGTIDDLYGNKRDRRERIEALLSYHELKGYSYEMLADWDKVDWIYDVISAFENLLWGVIDELVNEIKERFMQNDLNLEKFEKERLSFSTFLRVLYGEDTEIAIVKTFLLRKPIDRVLWSLGYIEEVVYDTFENAKPGRKENLTEAKDILFGFFSRCCGVVIDNWIRLKTKEDFLPIGAEYTAFKTSFDFYMLKYAGDMSPDVKRKLGLSFS